MSNPQRHLHYVEFTAPDLAEVKRFYGEVFGWEFTDWGPTYCSFSKESAGLDGGFEQGEGGQRGALLILRTDDLEQSYAAVKQGGGKIVVEPFGFPGGRRFQFLDPAGNELAVWIEVEEEG